MKSPSRSLPALFAVVVGSLWSGLSGVATSRFYEARGVIERFDSRFVYLADGSQHFKIERNQVPVHTDLIPGESLRLQLEGAAIGAKSENGRVIQRQRGSP